MLLGIVLHTALAYFPPEWEAWAFQDPRANSEQMGIVVEAIHLFRMPAFFLLSGFFGALLWKYRGAKGMLQNRFSRLVLPFVVFLLVLWPLCVFCFSFGPALLGGAEDPFGQATQEMLDTGFAIENTMHLWFLYYLVFVVAIFAILVATVGLLERSFSRSVGKFLRLFVEDLSDLLKKAFESPWLFVLLIATGNALFWTIFGWRDIPTSGDWWPNLTILLYYLGAYGFGWLIFSTQVDLVRFKDRAWTLLVLAFVFTALRIATSDWAEGSARVRHFNVGVSSLALAAYTRSLIGLFLRLANSGTHGWRYLSDSSYWVYLIHLPLTVVVPAVMMNWSLPVWPKFFLAMLLVSGICWFTYEMAVRASVVGRFLNGRRYPRSRLWKGSVVGTLLLVGWVANGMVHPPGLEDRPSPWAGGEQPQTLLPGEELVYPVLVPPGTEDDEAPHVSRCVGVGQYVFCPSRVDALSASEACVSLGGHLASLETEEESRVVQALANPLYDHGLWLALSDRELEGQWVWPDGEELRYSPWSEYEPNDWGERGEDCAVMYTEEEVRWNDEHCEGRNAFVCEMPCRCTLEAEAP